MMSGMRILSIQREYLSKKIPQIRFIQKNVEPVIWPTHVLYYPQMEGLEDHFGESAELDAETHAYINSYLSVEQENNKRSKMNKMRRSASAQKSLNAEVQHSLPRAENWNDIQKKLEESTGENGDLNEEGLRIITAYLDQPLTSSQSSATNGANRAGNKIQVSITALPYFIHKHDEIPKRMVTDNPKVVP